MQAVLEKRYGAGSPYNISQPEQNRFVAVLDNALYETVGFSLSDADLINIDNYLHETDSQVVQQEVNNCNFGELVFWSALPASSLCAGGGWSLLPPSMACHRLCANQSSCDKSLKAYHLTVAFVCPDHSSRQ